jgi:hypothetical protein
MKNEMEKFMEENKVLSEKEFNKKMKETVAKKVIRKDSPLKKWLVTYVGKLLKPENNLVTTEMIVSVLSEEFPEFLLLIAEENFIRGYKQATNDFMEKTAEKKKKLIERIAEAKAQQNSGSVVLPRTGSDK